MNISGLKSARKAKNLTQVQLASLLSVDPITISRYETGEREPSLEMIHRLCEVLCTSSDHLLGRDIAENSIETSAA